jgi:hypothetical protein
MRLKLTPKVLLFASLALLGLALILIVVFALSRKPGLEGPAAGAASVDNVVAVAGDSQVRCFAAGALVGEMSFHDCIARGGSASQLQAKAPAGAPAAATPDAAAIRAAAAAPDPAPAGQDAPVSGVARSGECLKFGPEGWRGYGNSISLTACVRVLYSGRCALPGQAFYGRWADKSLRLTPGRVEISDDNQHFRTLIDQNAQDCTFPAM